MTLQPLFIGTSLISRWQEAVENASGRVRVFSPRLTHASVLDVLGNANPATTDVYTRFSAMSFLSGESNLGGFRWLLNNGFNVYSIPELNASVLHIDGEFASIGSLQIAEREVEAIEASVVFSEPEAVDAVLEMVQPWMERATRIDHEDVNDAEAFVNRHESRFSTILDGAIEIDRRFLFVEVDEEDVPVRPSNAVIRSEIRQLLEMGALESYDVAQDLVWKSAWWVDHPSGPVRAPKMARHVYISSEGDESWIDYGANTFLVGRALIRVLRALDSCLRDGPGDGVCAIDGFWQDAVDLVQASVMNVNGQEISYPVTDDHGSLDLVFGAHSIDVNDFIEGVLDLVGGVRIVFGDDDPGMRDT